MNLSSLDSSDKTPSSFARLRATCGASSKKQWYTGNRLDCMPKNVCPVATERPKRISSIVLPDLGAPQKRLSVPQPTSSSIIHSVGFANKASSRADLAYGLHFSLCKKENSDMWYR